MNLKDLAVAVTKQGYQAMLTSGLNQHQKIMSGELSFGQFTQGIKVHYSDMIEQQNAQNSVVISPCVAITVLLNGHLSFALENKKHQLTCSKNKARLLINTINTDANFTRYMVKDQHVKKLTLSFDQQWLLSRTCSEKEYQLLSALFSQQTKASQFSCPVKIQELAEQIIFHKREASLPHQLMAEKLSLELISHCLPLFPTILNKEALEVCHAPFIMADNPSAFSARFKVLVNQYLIQLSSNAFTTKNLTLPHIAKTMGVSVSNLQRKIKAALGQSAMSYIKAQRLIHAKTLLLTDKLSIGEVSYLSGYNHSANFITAFKKYHGVTPAQLRDSIK